MDDAATEKQGSGSTLTVVIALAANALIAIAKTFAAVITGAASMFAEAAHSWADAGNEIFLLMADRRSRRPADERHPLGHGRDAYVWSLFAAFGLFAVGAAVSVFHGVQELFESEEAGNYLVSYIVLALAFILEGISFRRAVVQARGTARENERDLFDEILSTSDPTVRAVFFEDAAALIGVLIAFTGILLHQITGSPIPDAIGSILVGLLLGAVAVVLIQRNRRFIVGEVVDERVRRAALGRLGEHPEIASVSYLHIEYVGPARVFLVAAVDLVGDETEHTVAARLNAIEEELQTSERVVRAVLTLSAPGAAALVA
ncbi:cation diffusion facilitator family transporter [Herbiconiux sp. L3-i23]|uniref:cation diffusion facilitator family transporter n=1 Tax=Herbiconiux sp. L3-i23 TaxID=2905871 RepID=UPI0020621F1F|nr:cation diffusion facilitator family transporter [Herbiconiux sp. L3-i23]BDI22498.1 cation diffusion facilitator transporter [Herbiconiux sp. L3-i23]